MTPSTHRAPETPFVDTSFDEMNFGYSQATPSPSSAKAQTIDFSASPAFFGGLQGPSSPMHGNAAKAHLPYNHEYHAGPSSPSPAISGLDPISKLGFTSNRTSPQNQFGHNGFVHSHSPPQPFFPNHHHMPPQHFQYPHLMVKTPTPGYAPFQHEPPHNAYTVQQRTADAARRTAEVERRNRLREEEKARRTLAIKKQVDDGIAALKLEKDHAAHRTAEVERRNKQREEEKEKRRLAIQKQVEDGIKAIQKEKERERACVEADRAACRKWLSDLSPASASSSSTSTEQSADTVDLYAAVGRQLRGFWEESRPAASSQAYRNEVISDVQQAIDRKWPGHGLQVAAFGSSVTGLITESSDLDLVLLDPTRPYGVGTPQELRSAPNGFVRHSSGMPEWYSTNQVGNAIRNSNQFRNIVPISSASVPIVKMIHRKYDIPADININERFGLFNSQLIQAYADLQPQVVRPLIFFLKHWFSRRDLNDPAGKRGSMTFSSYTIALMALQVLQIQGVLPNLQNPNLLNTLNIRPNFLYARFKRVRRTRNGRPPPVEDETPAQKYNVTFATGNADMEPYKTRARELGADDAPTNAVTSTRPFSTDRLLGRMLVAFVRFYTQLDRRTQVVSVLNGSPLRRSEGSHSKHILFDSASEDDNTPGEPLATASRDVVTRVALPEEHKDLWAGEELVVQDPFIVNRNTSRNIKAGSIDKWQTTMESAFTLLGLHKRADAGEATKVRLEDAPLILDLCVPSSLRAEAKGNQSATGDGVKVANGEALEPWRLQEELAAQERELAKQAAQKLCREKKKQARSSKHSEARRLQEGAAMVEDMIDGFEAGFSSVPFTFSVSKSPALAVASIPFKTANANSDGIQQPPTGEAARSPTASTKTDGSSESEDIDLVALRLEQSTLDASP
ncbi:hypothetical protein [Sporisorium scitamineum]|uniref:Poly(A) RNA polymerase mitochondrial-like central palm domain-containing protein n=1 Tax=Sporisorium scitamineum TaxID=49012 RepID=A0A0F7S3N5_9BASI|nr:hypothetical protein [Sporisorium scitamineum]